MEKGRPGESYLLGGSNLSYGEFFNELATITGMKYNMIHMPIPLAELMDKGMLTVARITNGKPLITPPLVRKYLHHWCISRAKAKNELDYTYVDFRIGAGLTIDCLRKMK